MKNNKRPLIIILIILITIIIAYSILYIIFINSGTREQIMDNKSINQLKKTKWTLKKISVQETNGTITEENENFDISIEFNKEKVNICLSSNDCNEVNYRFTENSYSIDEEENVFLNGDITLLDNNQLLITRKTSDEEIAKYYFERVN